jgi:hypothetical protein
MQTLNYWKQFENTGKIEDYLSYKASDSQQSGERIAGCRSDYCRQVGSYAGIHTGDGNDFEAVSHGGVR